MPNIDVNTNSTNFGLLPTDTAQFSAWLDTYSTPGLSVYQDETNVASNLLSIAGSIDTYLYYYGYSSLTFVSQTELQPVSGPYIIDYYGSFSSTYSDVSKIFLYDVANNTSAEEFGSFLYNGYPVLSSLDVGSTLTGASNLVPSPSSPNSNVLDGVLLNTTWNGADWSGTINGYSEAISDTTDAQLVQVDVLEDPSAITFAEASPTSSEYLSMPPPTISGVGVVVSNYDTGVETDSLLVSGISYSSTSVVASQVLPTAMSGNDVVSVSGAGSLDIISGLVSDSAQITVVTLYDNAANVAANLDLLQTLAAEVSLLR
jgi:hypothetical protein